MKSIFKIFFTTTAVLLFSSCGNDWLDELPTNRIESNIAIRSIADAKSAVNGIYYKMQSSSYYGGRMSWHADIMGDDMRTWGNSSTRSGATYLYDYVPENIPSDLWSQPYAVIRSANDILEIIDELEVSPSQEDERNHIKGEALMARALAHFDINRTFGFPYLKDSGSSLGASLVTSPLSADSKPARSTVAETYNQVVIPDLLEAIQLLPSSKSDSEARFNKWAAKLLLSRIYLYIGDNTNALKEAEECITGAEAEGYRLYTHDNYLEQWQTKYSSESLFEIANIPGQNSGSNGIPNWFAANTTNAYHEIGLTKSFHDLLTNDVEDVRIKLLRKGVNYPDAFPAFVLKYTNGGSLPLESNVIIYRLSEAYLNAAEAASKMNNQNEKALKYVNVIVNRANPKKSLSGTISYEMVLEERRKELFGEGHRAFDLLRNGLTIYRSDDEESRMLLTEHSKVIDWNMPISIMPIPISEIEANPNIKQNP